ncbi:SCO-spondin-like, partial [Chroicocephalus ridibundus]|uniref:SCO-spondin-like n=1 Tax=Chroicocephalus ridibundus TaxID=1192867 RepID=UPI002FDD00A7
CRCPPGLFLQAGGCVGAGGCRCHLPGGQRGPGEAFAWGCRRCVCQAGTVTCQDVACAVACGWSAWSPWTPCRGGCGAGTQERFRSPTNPAAAGGGAPCAGAARETRECHQPCDTEPGWGAWTAWAACSASCGAGEQSRRRHCASPARGARNCTGPHLQTRHCSTQPCRARCPSAMVYRTAEECLEAGGPCPRLCRDREAGAECASLCRAGCACPPGLLLHNGTCLAPHRCPCHHRGRLYQPGDAVALDACNNWWGDGVAGATRPRVSPPQPPPVPLTRPVSGSTCSAGAMVCGNETCP